MHDLSSGQHSSIQIANSAEAPAPRVGMALAKVGNALYLWGRRGGKEMKPLSGELWKFEMERKEGKWRSSRLRETNLRRGVTMF